MTSTPNDPRHDPRGEIERARLQREAGEKASPESAGSRETFPEREKKPRDVGLANEARPGLGTRADRGPHEEDIAPPKPTARKQKEDNDKPKATRYGYNEPRPEPREQDPDSLAHEQERQTGVSGHTGNT